MNMIIMFQSPEIFKTKKRRLYSRYFNITNIPMSADVRFLTLRHPTQCRSTQAWLLQSESSRDRAQTQNSISNIELNFVLTAL